MTVARALLSTALASVLVMNAADGIAQAYPSKPIRLIVSAPAGSGPDVVGRFTAQKLTEGLGQQVFVENRTGAGGTLGAAAAAAAAPDGYTLFLGNTGALAIAPVVFPNSGFDAKTSFAPISLVATAPIFLLVHASVPANTLKELIDHVRSRPGKLNYSSVGAGSYPHVVMEMFKSITGLDLVHIPYKGHSFPGLIAGEVQVAVGSPAAFGPYVKSGRARVLAVASAARHSSYPDVPTASEAGAPGFEASTWYGLLAPRGTSPEVIARLNAETHKVVATKELREGFANIGADPVANSPEQFAVLIGTEAEKWGRAVKAAGVKLD